MLKDSFKRKFNKLIKSPDKFFADSKITFLKWVGNLFTSPNSFSGFYARFLTKSAQNKYFIGYVIVPTLLAAIYFIFIASPRYESYTKIIVKGEKTTSASPLGVMFPEMATDLIDLTLVKEYITSYDILEKLDHKFNLKEYYANNDEIDYFSSLKEKNAQIFYEYYNKRVKIIMDDTNSIMTIYYNDFSQEKSYEILTKIIELSQDYVNHVFDQIYQKELSFIGDNLDKIIEEIKEKRTVLLNKQDAYSEIDPKQNFIALSATLTELEAELLKEKASFSNLASYLQTDSPQIKFARDKIINLEEQLLVQRKKLINKNSQTNKTIALELENLTMEIELLFSQYKSSLISQEKAKTDMAKQLKHVIVVEAPFIPEIKTYPKTFYNISLFAIINLMLFFIFRLILSNIREHKEMNG
ncbi:MAG: capsular polysaccharide transport system permease protein [Rickettsiales bacterium]|jgi:capsular polysaccharide transport system permease protein